MPYLLDAIWLLSELSNRTTVELAEFGRLVILRWFLGVRELHVDDAFRWEGLRLDGHLDKVANEDASLITYYFYASTDVDVAHLPMPIANVGPVDL